MRTKPAKKTIKRRVTEIFPFTTADSLWFMESLVLFGKISNIPELTSLEQTISAHPFGQFVWDFHSQICSADNSVPVGDVERIYKTQLIKLQREQLDKIEAANAIDEWGIKQDKGGKKCKERAMKPHMLIDRNLLNNEKIFEFISRLLRDIVIMKCCFTLLNKGEDVGAVLAKMEDGINEYLSQNINQDGIDGTIKTMLHDLGNIVTDDEIENFLKDDMEHSIKGIYYRYRHYCNHHHHMVNISPSEYWQSHRDTLMYVLNPSYEKFFGRLNKAEIELLSKNVDIDSVYEKLIFNMLVVSRPVYCQFYSTGFDESEFCRFLCAAQETLLKWKSST